MAALFNPINHKREDIKWGLVSYTVTIFSFATILTGMALHVESLSYVDNCEMPGVEGAYPPGPTGYPSSIWLRSLSITPRLMFLFSTTGWLMTFWRVLCLILRSPTRASNVGFSWVYRCYIIYSKNLRIIVFPCFTLLASFGGCPSFS